MISSISVMYILLSIINVPHTFSMLLLVFTIEPPITDSTGNIRTPDLRSTSSQYAGSGQNVRSVRVGAGNKHVFVPEI